MDGSYIRAADTGPSPVDRRKTGIKHHLICDGCGTPIKVITTAVNVNDVAQTLALVDGIPPVAGRPGRPGALLGDKGYDSNPNRNALRKRRILPVISRKGCPNIKGMGKLRYVVEQTFALLHHFKRLAIRCSAPSRPSSPEIPQTGAFQRRRTGRHRRACLPPAGSPSGSTSLPCSWPSTKTRHLPEQPPARE